MLSIHLSSSPSPGPTRTTTTCDHFPQFSCSCDKTILLEISARDKSCFLWSVNFLDFLLAAWSKVFRKTLLSHMKEQVSRLAINHPIAVVQSVTVFRLILLHGWDTDLGLGTEKYHIASFVVSAGESLVSRLGWLVPSHEKRDWGEREGS